MIRILLPLLFLLSTAAAQTGFPEIPEEPDGMLSDTQQSYYWNHAAALAATWLNETHSPDSASIILPKKLVRSLHNALIRVHNSRGRQRDSVIKSDIGWPRWSSFYWTDKMTVDLRKAPWAKAWLKGKRLTGNAKVDALMKAYGLTPHAERNGRNSITVEFSTEDAARMWLIAEKLGKIKGIEYESYGAISQDDGEITAGVEGDDWKIQYRAGYINGFKDEGLRNRTWIFFVTPEGKVEYYTTTYTEPSWVKRYREEEEREKATED